MWLKQFQYHLVHPNQTTVLLHRVYYLVTPKHKTALHNCTSMFSFCLTFFPKNTNHSRGPWLPDRPNSWCNSCSAPLLLWRSEQKKQNANQFLYSRCKVKARRIWHFKVSKEEFSAAAVKRLASMLQWSSTLLCGRTNQTGRPQMLKGYNKKT